MNKQAHISSQAWSFEANAITKLSVKWSAGEEKESR